MPKIMPSVELKQIEKHYGGFHALKDINLDIEEGEFVVMVGPNSVDLQSTTLTVR